MLFFRRTYRPNASRLERALTASIVLALGVVLLWLRARGAAIDPNLFRLDDALLKKDGPSQTIFVTEVAVRESHALGLDPVSALLTERVPGYGFRRSGPVETFDPDTLYKKINGREALYKSFGFRQLWAASYELEEEIIEVEIFRQESPIAAFGVFSSERQGLQGAGLEAERTVTPNGLYFVAGPNYVRLLGSAASPSIRKVVDALYRVLAPPLGGEVAPKPPATPASPETPRGTVQEHLHVCPTGYDEPCSNAIHFPEASAPAPPLQAGVRLTDPASWTPTKNPLVQLGADPSSLEYHSEYGLGIEPFAGLYIGTFPGASGPVKGFLLARPNEEAGTQALAAYRSMLEKTAQPTEFSWPERTPPDRAQAKMDMLDTFEAGFRKGRWVAGVTEAEVQADAEALMVTLVELLATAP